MPSSTKLPRSIPVSVLVLTYNEEKNLPDCLKAVSFSDDIVVFDSFSSDRTVEIARSSGARIIQNRFEGYGQQREAARVQGRFRHPWVLSVDADERPDEELIGEIAEVVAGDSPHAAYSMRRKDFFLGRWIRHSSTYPLWFVRLMQMDRVQYPPRSVHEYPDVNGSVGSLRGHLMHYSFNKGLGDWLTKHVDYAQREAREVLRDRRARTDLMGAVQWRDPIRRRRALKQLAYRLPMRSVVKFLYMYGYKGGFLDGEAGLVYCQLIRWYEYLIDVHIKNLEMQRNET